MEVEQVHLDLLDLRQLYCFMHSCFSGQQNSRIEILGGRARLLLKSLLDDATAKVFMAYSKIVETPNVSDELCSSQPEKTKNCVPQPKLVFEAPPWIVSGQTQNKSTPPTGARNPCRACVRRSTMKRNTCAENNPDVSDRSDGLAHFHGDDEQTRESTENKSRTRGHEKSSSLNTFISCASTSHETTGYGLHCQREREKQDAAIDYSEDISNTIKKIESQILALKLRSRSRNHALESGPGRLSGARESSSPFRSDLLINPVGQVSKNKSFAKAIPSQGLSLRSDFGRSECVSTAVQLRGCEQEVKRNATVGRIESLSQSARQASPPEFVHGFVVPSVPENPGVKDLTRRTVGSHPSRYGSPSGRRRATNMPRQMIMMPTLLDHPTSKLTVLPTPIKNRTDRVTQRNNQMGRVVSRKKRNFPREGETEKTQSSSSASSSRSWASTASSSPSLTSQQSGASSSDSRDCSSPRQYVGPKASPTKRRKLASHKGSEKMIGGLKRLKNKLGLILHHHHHHHHNTGDGQLRQVNGRHSMWEHLGNLFHNAQKDRPLKKCNKSRVKEAARRKDQVGHFHALVEGFMRHVWKSGRSQPSKGKMRGLRRQKKKKKTVKKVRRWKLPNKAKLARLVI